MQISHIRRDWIRIKLDVIIVIWLLWLCSGWRRW